MLAERNARRKLYELGSAEFYRRRRNPTCSAPFREFVGYHHRYGISPIPKDRNMIEK
jgi:hypothetical protein